MAGPGGGPPRRSHTKSRKGCDSCKRRHIRCDENFPQCRNCTKHKVRCPYHDAPPSVDRSTTPDKPDLQWTPEISHMIRTWQQTRVFPFAAQLNMFPGPDPDRWNADELRLMHHLLTIYCQLEMLGANNFTIWTAQIPRVFAVASTYDFVMHSLLAFSAMHMSYLTACPNVGNLEYVYRGLALKGLQQHISKFSRETSDAVLAASMVLSWQATDWRDWTQLMQGTSTVMDAMEGWKNESLFVDFINHSRTFPTAPASPSMDQRSSQQDHTDPEPYNTTLQQLQTVEGYLKQSKNEPLVKTLGQLIGFYKGSRKVSSTYSVPQQFDRLRPLRTFLFWLPITMMQTNSTSAPCLLAMAQFYMVSLLMERSFPEIGAAYFGSLCIGPLEDIAKRLNAMASSTRDPAVGKALSLMATPLATATQFRGRMGFSEPVRTPSFPTFSLPGVYRRETVPVPAPPSTGPYHLPYDSPAFSYSAESLGLLRPETTAPNNAISPLSLTPPTYNSGGHYLGIPSPSYGGGLSPASSTFEGSVTYSEPDDLANYDLGGASDNMPMMGHHPHNLGLGMSQPTTRTGSLLPTPDDTSYAAASPWLIPLPDSPVPPSATFPRIYHHRHARSNSSALGGLPIKQELIKQEPRQQEPITQDPVKQEPQ